MFLHEAPRDQFRILHGITANYMFPSLVVQYQSHARGMFVNNREARDHLTLPRIMAVERPRLRYTVFLAFLPL